MDQGWRTVTVVVCEASAPRSSTTLQVAVMVAGESALVLSVAVVGPTGEMRPELALKLKLM
jgi:hypothetical protein